METLCYVIAALFGVQLLWSYYTQCYRKGYTIDFWHFGMFQTYFVMHAMLPFNRSNLNVISLGGLVTRTQAHVTQAYLIGAVGYFFILVGGSLWRVDLGFGLRRFYSDVAEKVSRAPLLLLESKPLLLFHGVVSILCLMGVLAYYFKTAGFGFSVRGLLLVSPGFRPVAQFAAFYSVLIGSFCVARYTVRRETSMLLVLIPISVALIFYGERSNYVAMMASAILVVLVRMGRRLKPIYLFGAFPLLLLVMFEMDLLRKPGFSQQDLLARLGMNVFYGNSFSDTRDFALVLSFWDGKYFHGLTYLAGLLAFIPRAISPFRDKWALGVVTAGMAGFSPQQHPGFRPGSFGEVFLNFGIVGVMLLGLLMGVTARYVDQRMKQALRVLPRTSVHLFGYAILGSILGALALSVNASGLYSVLLIYLLSWIFYKVCVTLKLWEPGT